MRPNGYLYNDGNVISRNETLKMGIKMFHYSCVRKEQIDFKTKFFKNKDYEILWEKWHQDHNTPLIGGVKTVEYRGEHPFNISEV